ncbi:MAG TPA: hypothetical protein DEB64_03200 [Alistipes sp.]|nr:hypothetical protein [Alistipes sp.]
MLDAAHGEAVGPVVPIQRVHVVRPAVQAANVQIARGVGRRRPNIAVLADDDQGSRLTVAGARSRVHWQSLG